MESDRIKKKILIYSPIFFPDIGGPAIQGKYLAEVLADYGFEVFVIKYSKSVLFNPKFKVISLNWLPNPSAFRKAYRWFFGPLTSIFYLLRIRPNLVIVNSVFWNGMVIGLLCRIVRIPTILKFAGDWVFESLKDQKKQPVDFLKIYNGSALTRFLFLIEKFFVSKFNVVWVISEFRKKNVQQLSKSPKIWLQSNFHNLPQFSFYSSSRFTSPIIFVTSARLIPHKRIDTLIDTVSKLNYDFRLIIIGEGPELKDLTQLVKVLKLETRVFFLGKISSDLLFEILALSSAYLSWSAEEGAPNAFIEALNFGLPIITANVGGIPEMFESNSKSVKLIDPNEPSQLLVSLSSLNLASKELEAMSKAAFIEGKKFLRSENEIKVVEFIHNLLNSKKR
jgi:glycosyltransferase involved in cell wall biosynthesis